MILTIGHVRYINIQAWLRGFWVKIANFSSLFCLSIPIGELDTKETTSNIEVWPESLGAKLEYWYIERGLLETKDIWDGPEKRSLFRVQAYIPALRKEGWYLSKTDRQTDSKRSHLWTGWRVVVTLYIDNEFCKGLVIYQLLSLLRVLYFCLLWWIVHQHIIQAGYRNKEKNKQPVIYYKLWFLQLETNDVWGEPEKRSLFRVQALTPLGFIKKTDTCQRQKDRQTNRQTVKGLIYEQVGGVIILYINVIQYYYH